MTGSSARLTRLQLLARDGGPAVSEWLAAPVADIVPPTEAQLARGAALAARLGRRYKRACILTGFVAFLVATPCITVPLAQAMMRVSSPNPDLSDVLAWGFALAVGALFALIATAVADGQLARRRYWPAIVEVAGYPYEPGDQELLMQAEPESIEPITAHMAAHAEVARYVDQARSIRAQGLTVADGRLIEILADRLDAQRQHEKWAALNVGTLASEPAAR